MNKSLCLLLSAAIILFSCKQKQQEAKEIIIDIKKHALQKRNGDSIWWIMPESVVDRIDTSGSIPIQSSHYLPMEFKIGLKNLNLAPFVIVTDIDTLRYWYGDTLHLGPLQY